MSKPQQPLMQSLAHTKCDRVESDLCAVTFARKGESGELGDIVRGLLAGKDGAGSDADALRRELIERSRAGEQIELELTARTYFQQPGTVNRKFIEFSPRALSRLAKSGPGTPFIRNHSLWDTDASAGTAVKTVQKIDGDKRELIETLRIVVPWGTQAALDGRMSQFSIGAECVGDWRRNIQCTACKRLASECGHWPGQLLVAKDGTETRVIWRYLDAAMVERSWVLYPAVAETETQGWRQLWVSLKAPLETAQPIAQPKENIVKLSKLIDLLGLAADASEETITAAVEALKAEKPKLTARVAELERVSKTAEAAKDKAETEVEALRAKIAEAETARLTAENEKRIESLCAAGKLSPAQAESVRQRLTAGDKAGAEALLSFADNAAPSVVGAPKQTREPVTLARTTIGTLDFSALLKQLPEYERLSARYRTAPGAEAYCRSNWTYVAKTLGLPDNPDAV